ncbi:hypothetical protein Fmac_033006 [Flemingia macrophylla]|uniref:Uncharacterized protein n=1 Tax=Flemingia macrophylla TaxID=520843 RepID=A0ABD1L7Z9_9FABA
MGQIHSQTVHCFFFPIQSTGKLFELLLHDPSVSASLLISSFQILQRELHSRNKKALEFIAKGWNALKEVDRVIDYCKLNDKRLIPLLRVINTFSAYCYLLLYLRFDASEVEEVTYLRFNIRQLRRILSLLWKLTTPIPMQYEMEHVVLYKVVQVKLLSNVNSTEGATLLVEAAEIGDPDAQYALGCHLRVENDYVQTDQQAFYYLEKAVDQLHPGALYLLGVVYLIGDCVKKDIASALWCFHRASEKGHVEAAIAYGSLLLKGKILAFALRFGKAPS